MASYVLVHGAYHGAWCWYKVKPSLETRGHDVTTFDLPAHGIDMTPPASVSFDDYVTQVCDAIDHLEESIILVGHSMAGMVITQAAERRVDAIDTVVYLTAYLPADGESMIDQRVEGSLISRNFTVDEPQGVGIVEDDAITEIFYADCSSHDQALARSLFRPEPVEPLRTPVSISTERFGSVRRAYIRCEHDQGITDDQQRSMIEENRVDIEVSLPSSHSPFFSMPEETVDALESVA